MEMNIFEIQFFCGGDTDECYNDLTLQDAWKKLKEIKKEKEENGIVCKLNNKTVYGELSIFDPKTGFKYGTYCITSIKLQKEYQKVYDEVEHNLW